MTEIPVVFDCQGAPLVSIVHRPELRSTTGVLIVVAGGPQYRVGAHRQFVELGRRLADSGIAVMRFDHRGTGDSGGDYGGYLDMNEDIRAATDRFLQEVPELSSVALWGECESATAAAFYAHHDPRIQGIFMVNPWIRTEAGRAKTYLRHHYWNRLRDPQFWRKLKSGEFSLRNSLSSLIELLKSSKRKAPTKGAVVDSTTTQPLPERFTLGLSQFSGEMVILTSGRDYIAQEFTDFMQSSGIWKRSGLNRRIVFSEMTDADHTFSRAIWREELFATTERWLQHLPSRAPQPTRAEP
ncbi:MAG: hydrolase 1, exosortase A system-associated [Parahaliea sp.]